MKEKKEKINLEKLKDKLKECEKLKAEYLAGWQRARADFLNYKKEETERISEFLKFGKEELILKILPTLDSFQKARSSFVKVSKDKQKEKKLLIEGFLQIEKQLKNFLKNEGIEEIEVKSKTFDPNFHEAVEQVTVQKESGTIIEELEKGYTLYGKVIRPAKVKVAK